LANKSLHLVIPGLLAPWPNSDKAGSTAPKVPALERLLARANVKTLAAASMDSTLFSLFGLPADADRDLPIAAITRFADGGDPAQGWWLRADPVNLCADLQQVLLFDARGLGISVEEAHFLVAEFNQTFATDGLFLEAPCPTRWYLRLATDPGLRTCPLLDAIGRNIHSLLPTGTSSRRCHALLTEIQMLFHSATVNVEREARGQPLINSVWFWGGGTLPQGTRSPAKGVYAVDPLTRGLARLAGISLSPPPDHADDWRQASTGEAESLAVLEATRFDRVDNALPAWLTHITALERDWFSPCLTMLQGKVLNSLRLYPDDGHVYEITTRHLGRFWRRARPVLYYCQTR